MTSKIFRVMLVTLLLVVALPAWGAAIQVFDCEHGVDVTDVQLDALASEWLKAAKLVPGGENIQASMHFPVAANAGDIDFKIVIVTPTFEDWGKFTDAYEGSAAQAVDEKQGNLVECGKSTVWESYKVK